MVAFTSILDYNRVSIVKKNTKWKQ